MTRLPEGKVAMVTGAGSGIGRASALAFAKNGAKVVVNDIVAEGAEETVEMIKAAGGEAILVKADVTQAIEVENLINKTVEIYGQLDYAHNNAGIDGEPAPLADCTIENWDRTIGINLRGVFLCMKYEIPQMVKQGNGAIVNTASIAGLIGTANMPAYNAAKHGVVGLTRTAALEYAATGIRINAVCPGATRTALLDSVMVVMPELLETLESSHPVGRIAEPEEIANTVVWLCSDEASFVTGHPMVVDGGYSVQ
ncbi:MAG: SDR family oxidoreductase [Chloroflexi bacterium]|nr:SDR family oxidoreductase [Chloroflexota bacterium]